MKVQSELVEISRGDMSKHLSTNELKLITATEEAKDQAYAPYSNFKVGAAALLSSGEILQGNNQENAAYPSGLCAERVLLNFIKANYAKESIEMLAVVTDKSLVEDSNLPVPCGSCLQTMNEVESRQMNEMKIVLIAKNTVYLAQGVKQFLPFRFVL